jgi:hypothetical protein
MSLDECLGQSILAIGCRAVTCKLHCDGVVNDAASGTLPRSLMLEAEGRSAERGSVVLGINPGQGREEEKAYYLAHGNTYEAFLAFWRERLAYSHPYHVRTRRFLDQVGLTGSILWTELVKCESSVGARAAPPLSTLRTCVNRYLANELLAVPLDWPIVALGRKPFELAAIMFPGRWVIGIPHPTGSRGQFHHLFAKEGRLQNEIAHRVAASIEDRSRSALWVTEG